MTRDEIAEIDPDALFMDDFDEAITGYILRCGQPLIVAYDWEKCIEVLMADGLTREEASEHMEYNVTGAWVGDRTPAVIQKPC